MKLLFEGNTTFTVFVLVCSSAFLHLLVTAEAQATPFPGDPSFSVSIPISKHSTCILNGDGTVSPGKVKGGVILITTKKSLIKKSKSSDERKKIKACRAPLTESRLKTLTKAAPNKKKGSSKFTLKLSNPSNAIKIKPNDASQAIVFAGQNIFPSFDDNLKKSFTIMLIKNEVTKSFAPYPINYLDQTKFSTSAGEFDSTQSFSFFFVNSVKRTTYLSQPYSIEFEIEENGGDSADPGIPIVTPQPTNTPEPVPSATPDSGPTPSNQPTSTPTATPVIGPSPSSTPTPDMSVEPLVRYNLGDLNGYSSGEEGYTLVSESSSTSAITFQPHADDTVHVASYFKNQGVVGFPAHILSIDPDQVVKSHLFTALKFSSGTTITLNSLPTSQKYRIRLELGGLYPWKEFNGKSWDTLSTTIRDLQIDVLTTSSWERVVDGLNIRTGSSSATFKDAVGNVSPIWINAHSDSGGSLSFRASTGSGDPVFIAGMEIYPYEPLPIQYKRSTNGPLVANNPILEPFIEHFNNFNFEQAKLIAETLDDAFARGSALIFLVGWLDGSKYENSNLIAPARDALSDAISDGHPGAIWALDQLEQYKRALDHLDARGYTWAYQCPDQGGTGFLNPACAGQSNNYLNGQSNINLNSHIALRLLEPLFAAKTGDDIFANLAEWNLGEISSQVWEPSPLVFSAAKRYGTTITLMNPLLQFNLSGPLSVEILSTLRRIFNGFINYGFASSDFPKDLELRLYQRFAELGVNPSAWEFEDLDLFTDQEIAQSWWASAITLETQNSSDPEWVTIARQYSTLMRAVIHFWLDERLKKGELGGGIGDDIEFALQAIPLLGAKTTDHSQFALSRLHSVFDKVLFGSDLVDQGYYSGGYTDVEHSAEFTTNPATTILAIDGMNGDVADIAFGAAAHLISPPNGYTPFGGISQLGRIHFKSYVFNTFGPKQDVVSDFDIPLNGRAVIPGIALARYSPNSDSHTSVDDLVQWAHGWLDDALTEPSEAIGKPKGFFPATVAFPSNKFDGKGYWYSFSGNLNDNSVLSKGEYSYLLSLLQMAYHKSSDSDRWKFLLPAVRILRAVQQWEDNGQPQGAIGSKDWAAQEVRQGQRFGPLVMALYNDLASNSFLTSTLDPDLNNSTTYVDQTLVERMYLWTAQLFGTKLSESTRYALQPQFDCAANNVKTTHGLSSTMKAGVEYLKTVFPFITKGTAKTDRVALSNNGAPIEYLARARGVDLVEGIPFAPLVHWKDPSDSITIFTNGRDYQSSFWSGFVFNSKSTPIQTELTLERGLQSGIYKIEMAPSSEDCDLFESQPIQIGNLDLRLGGSSSISVTIPPGLHLIRASRISQTSAPGTIDLTVTAPKLTIHTNPSGSSIEISVDVINVGSSPAPSSVLSLSAIALDSEGNQVSLPTSEVLISESVTLPATTGWQLARHTSSTMLDDNSQWIDAMLAGKRIKLVATISQLINESDRSNNQVSRSWSLDEVQFVSP